MRLLKPDGDTNTMKSRSKYHGKRPPNHLVCALANLFGVFLGKETVLSLWKLGISFVGYKREYCTPTTFIENRLFACKQCINRFAHCNHWKWFRVFIKGETLKNNCIFISIFDSKNWLFSNTLILGLVYG